MIISCFIWLNSSTGVPFQFNLNEVSKIYSTMFKDTSLVYYGNKFEVTIIKLTNNNEHVILESRKQLKEIISKQCHLKESSK